MRKVDEREAERVEWGKGIDFIDKGIAVINSRAENKGESHAADILGLATEARKRGRCTLHLCPTASNLT